MPASRRASEATAPTLYTVRKVTTNPNIDITISGPSVGVLYQLGTKPQRIGARRRRPLEAVTTGTAWVGQMLNLGLSGKSLAKLASNSAASAVLGWVKVKRPHMGAD